MKIILIDGPDGVGKTTIANKVVELLKKDGIKSDYVHFPNYHYDTGAYIKKLLYGELGDFTELNPYAAHIIYSLDRFAWFKQNTEYYKDYYIVMDRYKFSSLVYQSALYIYQIYKDLFSYIYNSFGNHFDYGRLLNVLIEDNKNLNEFHDYMIDLETNKLCLPDPDIFIWITADEDTIEARKNNADRYAKDNYEDNIIFSKLVYHIGNMYANSDHNCATVLHNNYDIDTTVDDVINHIASII